MEKCATTPPTEKVNWSKLNIPKDRRATTEWCSNRYGTPRCSYIRKNGTRCEKFAMRDRTRCAFHSGISRTRLKDNVYTFPSQALQKAYDYFRTDPNRLDLSGELAVVRMLIQGYIDKLSEVHKLKDIGMTTQLFLMDQIEKCSSLVEKMARQQKNMGYNIEQMISMMEAIVYGVAKVTDDPEKVQQLIEYFNKLQWPNERFDAEAVQQRIDEKGERGEEELDWKALESQANQLLDTLVTKDPLPLAAPEEKENE